MSRASISAAIMFLVLCASVGRADSPLYADNWWYWGWPPGDCPTIPDNGCSTGNKLIWSVDLSGAPANAVVTSVTVEYWINNHTYWPDLQVYLTTNQNGQWYDEWLWNQGSGSGDLHRTKTFLSEYDGLSPNATWYFVACDDAAQDVGCVDEWIIWVYYIVPPDLYDDGQSYCGFSPNPVCTGQPFSVWCDVRNGGGSSSGGFYVDFYASTNTTITTSDYRICRVPMSSIAASAYGNCDWSGPFPDDIPAGTYWVGWIIDADDDVEESNENNNVAYKQAYQLTVRKSSVAPTGINANPSAVCPGSSSTLTVQGGSLGTGASWEWYSGSCGGTHLGSGSSIVVSPMTNTTFYVRAEGSCNSTSCASRTVTIKTLSAAPSGISASANPICPGTNTTLTVQGGSLGTGASWEWYSGSCGGTYVGTGSSITVSPSVNTTYFVRAEGDCNTTGCTSLTITMKTQSTAPSGASANPSSICAGSSSTLSVQGGSLGAGASWKWYSGSCGGSYVGSGASITVTPSSTTTYYVRAEGDCNTTGCAQVTVTVKTQSTAPTGIAVSPNPPICPGECVTLTLQGGSLGTGASWKWYVGSCGGILLGSGASIVVCPTTTTTYYVRAEGDCNTTNCVSVPVTVKTLSTAPTGATADPSSVCPAYSSTLTVQGGSLGTGASWKWYSGSCGGTLVGSGSPITVTPSSTTTYYVRAEGDCNTTGCAQVTVTVAPTVRWYRDGDTDGYGDPLDYVDQCEQPSGYVSNDDDCDDSNASVHPGATEICGDGVDNDCEGGDAVCVGACCVGQNCHVLTLAACGSQGGTYKGDNVPCDASTCPAPGACCVGTVCSIKTQADCTSAGGTYKGDNTTCGTETCLPPGACCFGDGSCQNLTQSACSSQGGTWHSATDCAHYQCRQPSTWYRDADGDGWGDATHTKEAIEKPDGYVAKAGDCDDADDAVHPGATEVCDDGKDNDCDGNVDEGCPGFEQTTPDVPAGCCPQVGTLLLTFTLIGLIRYRASRR